jgi:hypothetical protein
LARSIAAGWLCSFGLIQKNQKIKSAGSLLCAHPPLTHCSGHALQIGQNHGLQLFCPASLALSQCFCKNLLCPFHLARATIVLPAFTRSFPADEREEDSGYQESGGKKER